VALVAAAVALVGALIALALLPPRDGRPGGAPADHEETEADLAATPGGRG